MNDIFGGLKKGLFSAFGPNVAKGALVSFLKDMEFKQVMDMVKKDEMLWDYVPDLQRSKVIEMASTMDTSWLTVEWLIEAVRKDLPYVASYFLSSPKALTWLQKQVEDIQEKIRP